MQAFGITAEDAAEAAGPADPVVFDVWPCNAEPLGLFMALATQWNYCEGSPAGIRYESALAVMRIYRVKDKRGMLDRLNIMERAALKVFRARK